MIKISGIFRGLLYIAVFFLADYVYIFAPNFMQGNATSIRFVIGLVGVLSTVALLYLNGRKFEKSPAYALAEKYLLLYTFIIVFTMAFTIIRYDYNFTQIMFSVTPYLYIYYSLPLIYLCEYDKKPFHTIKVVAVLLLLMLFIKLICWLLYTFTGAVVFNNLIFFYGENWIRDGFLRIDPGCLFGVAFSVMFAAGYTNAKQIKYKLSIVIMLLFLMFITRFRFQIVTALVVTMVGVYVASDNKKERHNKIILGITVVFLFVGLGGFSTLLSSFTLEGEYGGSTFVRLLTTMHYWSLMVDKKAIFGLGLLNQGNINCYVMMERTNMWGQRTWYFLEDIGILGGFFRFGILSIPLYGVLFHYGIKAYKKCRYQGQKGQYVFLACAVSYMMFSNLALNIFDGQRAFATPFYLAIISYCYGTAADTSPTQTME